jgi:hypothetical protein
MPGPGQQTADPWADNRGPGAYQPLAAATATAVAGPDFARATERDGLAPPAAATPAAAAAAAAARRLMAATAAAAQGDTLLLRPDIMVTKPRPPRVVINPEPCNSLAVRDPQGFAAAKEAREGIWQHQLCAAYSEAVQPRPPGFKGVVGFSHMLGREEVAAAAGLKPAAPSGHQVLAQYRCGGAAVVG